METSISIRPSPIAGKWYPGDPHRLANSVDSYLAAAHLPELPGKVVAVVAPHAGHIYSGPVAGYAFAALRGLSVEIVAVVSPMHYPFTQSLLTSAHSAYRTPLGDVPVAQEAIAEIDAHLQSTLGYPLAPISNDQEHSLEIELPFLQRALPQGFRLAPVMVRDQSMRVVKALGQALAQALKDKEAILVASTDLSHFYPQKMANILDGEVLKRLEAFDPQGVLQAEDEGKGFACGRGALAAVLWAAKELGADAVKVLHYATSGDVTGDFDQVVGYGAAAVLRSHNG